MAKIINPEKQCKTTPESFNIESQIERVDREDYRRGIILDSLEEFCQAIVAYNGDLVEGSKATQDNLMDALGDKGDGMGADLLLIVGRKNSYGFIKRLVNEAVSSLKESGRFYKSFHHEAMGTNFMQTTVEGNRVGDKYVLSLYAAYVGTEPEEKLVETLEKPLALVRSDVKGRLSVVDDWWFNLNLEDAVKNLPLPNGALKDVDQWTQYFASGGYRGKKPKYEFEHNGRKFSFSIRLNTEKFLRPEGRDYNYMQARGKFIVGGAWTTWDETGNNKVEPRIEQPSLVCSVSLHGEEYSRPPAVTSEEMETVQSARDYIAGLIQPKE